MNPGDNPSGISSVLVVGAGAMGSQISMVCARAGLATTLTDVDREALDRAVAQLTDRIDAQVAKGRITEADRDEAWSRLRTTTDLDEAAAGVDLVVEAVVEKLDVKTDLFARLDRLCPPHTILASNSSSLVPSKMAAAAERPDRVCNIHFFNPALVMTGVEVVRGPQTSEATMTAAVGFVTRIGKQPIVLEKEIHGFVANRILGAVREEAIRLYEGGYASPEAIDLACRTALRYPMGPFELMDLTGIDIGYYSRLARYEETGDPADAPSRSVTERVERGHLGRKTGRGWYAYAPDGTRIDNPDVPDDHTSGKGA